MKKFGHTTLSLELDNNLAKILEFDDEVKKNPPVDFQSVDVPIDIHRNLTRQ